jgi:hypothetical protein
MAFKEKNQKGLSTFKKGDKEIDPNPFYLVWNNFSESDKGSHGDALKWPFQLMEIQLR